MKIDWNQLRPFVNLSIMNDVYYALFYSQLVSMYGDQLVILINIEVLQKRAVINFI